MSIGLLPDFTREFICEQWVSNSLGEVFNFSSNEKNLEAIPPKWVIFHSLKKSTEQIQAGTEIDYKISLHGYPMRWRTLISDWNPPHQFIDIQSKGPYSFWRQSQQLSEANGGSTIRDHIQYKLPFSIFWSLVRGP